LPTAAEPAHDCAGCVIARSASGDELSGSEAQWSVFERSLAEGLRERGYVEGKNLTLLRRYGELQGARIRGAAAELAGLNVDAIVTSCAGTTRSAANAAPNTPVVFASVADPVLYGLVESLPRPGGNITGRASMSVELVPKRLEILRLLLPDGARGGARFAVLTVANDPWHEVQWRSAQGGAAALNLNLVRVELSKAEIDSALDALARSQVQGVVILADNPTMIELRAPIAAALMRLKLPSISGLRLFADAGINLKTASALGITVPRELLLRADATIE
jgi:putative ABC transport system substrate-binding protein